jgi:hypothetical protein
MGLREMKTIMKFAWLRHIWSSAAGKSVVKWNRLDIIEREEYQANEHHTHGERERERENQKRRETVSVSGRV